MSVDRIMTDPQVRLNGEVYAFPKPLPYLYRRVTPLSPKTYGFAGFQQRPDYRFAEETAVVPITVDEFAAAGRHLPIVFSKSAGHRPVALLGTKDGENRLVGDDGAWRTDSYVPAYLRRYPFILARPKPGAKTMYLCVDDTDERILPTSGEPLFEDGATPTACTKHILNFCHKYEIAAERSWQLAKLLNKHDLLFDASIRVRAGDAMRRYGGFLAVDRARLAELPDDALDELGRTGALAAIYAHLASIQSMANLERR
ncbi:MAG: SapC family protein [Pacificimonas sp.]